MRYLFVEDYDVVAFGMMIHNWKWWVGPLRNPPSQYLRVYSPLNWICWNMRQNGTLQQSLFIEIRLHFQETGAPHRRELRAFMCLVRACGVQTTGSLVAQEGKGEGAAQRSSCGSQQLLRSFHSHCESISLGARGRGESEFQRRGDSVGGLAAIVVHDALTKMWIYFQSSWMYNTESHHLKWMLMNNQK